MKSLYTTIIIIDNVHVRVRLIVHMYMYLKQFTIIITTCMIVCVCRYTSNIDGSALSRSSMSGILLSMLSARS